MSTDPVTMADLTWTFGDHLRKIRRTVGVSQADFAGVLQVGRQSLASWESGLATPRNAVAVAKRIELAYGVPAAWTLGLETQITPGPGGPGGTARSEGLEPPTFCSVVPDGLDADVVPLFPSPLPSVEQAA